MKNYRSRASIVEFYVTNGTYSDYSYDTLSRLTELSNYNSLGEIISGFQYTYDKVGNRLSMSEANAVTGYEYDSLYRLIRAEEYSDKTLQDEITPNSKQPKNLSAIFLRQNSGRQSKVFIKTFDYQYDEVGNRLKKEEREGSIQTTASYEYDRGNQLLKRLIKKRKGQEPLRKKKIKYQYDANGNRIKKKVIKESGGKKVTLYRYDYNDMLRKIIFPSGEKNLFKNSTLSGAVRTYKKDSTGVREYFFDGGVRVLMEFNRREKIKAKYTLGPGIDEIISKAAANKTYYYHYDGLGSVTELTDESGEVVERLRYKPFGQLKEGGGSNSFAFTGREYDQDSGLYYYRSRYYNSATGRFLSRDPIGVLGGNNLYLYVGNNPVNWVDPWGLWRWYGNWGGPGWTSGDRRSESDLPPKKWTQRRVGGSIKTPTLKQEVSYGGREAKA